MQHEGLCEKLRILTVVFVQRNGRILFRALDLDGRYVMPSRQRWLKIYRDRSLSTVIKNTERLRRGRGACLEVCFAILQQFPRPLFIIGNTVRQGRVIE